MEQWLRSQTMEADSDFPELDVLPDFNLNNDNDDTTKFADTAEASPLLLPAFPLHFSKTSRKGWKRGKARIYTDADSTCPECQLNCKFPSLLRQHLRTHLPGYRGRGGRRRRGYGFHSAKLPNTVDGRTLRWRKAKNQVKVEHDYDQYWISCRFCSTVISEKEGIRTIMAHEMSSHAEEVEKKKLSPFYKIFQLKKMDVDVNPTHLFVQKVFKRYPLDQNWKVSKEVESVPVPAKVKYFGPQRRRGKAPIYSEADSTCPHCQLNCKFPSSLRTHLKTHLPGYRNRGRGGWRGGRARVNQSSSANYANTTCVHCERTYNFPSVLWQHQKVCSKAKAYRRSLGEMSDGSVVEDCDNRPKLYLQCELCSHISVNQIGLLNHRNIVHKICTPPVGSNTTSDNIVQLTGVTVQVPNEDEPQLQPINAINPKSNNICKFCLRSFASATGLTMHERIHTGEKPYTCKHCDLAFSRTSSRNRHQKTHAIHKLLLPGQDGCKCRFCDIVCMNETGRKLHERRIHKSELVRVMVDEVSSDGSEQILPVINGASGEEILPITPPVKLELFQVPNHVELSSEPEPEFECDVCGLFLLSSIALADHKVLVHGLDGNEIDPLFLPDAGPADFESNGSSNYLPTSFNFNIKMLETNSKTVQNSTESSSFIDESAGQYLIQPSKDVCSIQTQPTSQSQGQSSSGKSGVTNIYRCTACKQLFRDKLTYALHLDNCAPPVKR